MKTHYLEQGYLHQKQFFDPAVIADILTETKWVFLQQMHRCGIAVDFDHDDENLFCTKMHQLFAQDFAAFVNCGKQVQHAMKLHRLALDEQIEQELKNLGLEHPNICTRPVLYFNHPSLAKEKVYHTVFSHQDWRSMQGSLDSMVIWVPLIDIDRTAGALEIIPGSHKKGLLTEEVEAGFGKVDESSFGDEAFLPVEVAQGDALFFSSFLVHRSGNNTSDRIRWSCHFRYNNLSEPGFIERKYHHNYIYKPNDALHTPDYPKQSDINAIFEPNR